MAGRYVKQQWQSGVIASPFGPINGPRLNYLEGAMSQIYDDHDAHVAGVGDVHPQYLLEPAMVANGVLWSTGAAWTVAKITKDQISPVAGILKSQLASLALVDADVQGPISKGKLDLVGQITQADLAPGISLIPTGTILDFGGDVAPAGFVLADGATYDGTNSTYTPLWGVFGLKFGGTGQNAFKVPDCRGRMTVGKGTHADVDTIGESDPTALAARTPKHTHLHALTLPAHVHSDPGHAHSYSVRTEVAGSGSGSAGSASAGSTTGTSVTNMGNPTTSPLINGTIGNVSGTIDAPSYIVLNKIVKL